MSIREWSRGAWAGVAGVIAVLAVVVGVAVAVSADDGDADTSSSPEASDPATTDSPSSSASSPPTDKPKPPPEIDYLAVVKRAAADGLAPLVPSGGGWVVTAAEYRDGSWQLVLEDGESQTQVIQTSGVEPAALVSRHLADARQGDAVDLRRWQLGEWSSWTDESRHALSHEFKHGVVVVTGDDPGTVLSATQSLLTYETGRGGEGD
jgi:hypothetical protein